MSARTKADPASLPARVFAHLVAWVAAIFVYVAHPQQIRTFRSKHRRWPRPGVPRRYADLMLWRKTFDHDPRFTRVSDKLLVKEFAHEVLGDAIKTPRTLWVGHRPEDIPAEVLTGSVVVKANHSYNAQMLVLSGNVVRGALERQARAWMTREHHVLTGEWAYIDVDRKLFVEEMLMENGEPVAMDLKFHIFAGRTVCVNVITDRHTDVRATVIDHEGNAVGDVALFPSPATPPHLPPNFAHARDLAEKLSAGFDYIRVDLYVIGDDVYLGELTVYPGAGWREFNSEALTAEMSAAWDIRRSWFVSQPHDGPAGLYAWALRVILGSPTEVGAER